MLHWNELDLLVLLTSIKYNYIVCKKWVKNLNLANIESEEANQDHDSSHNTVHIPDEEGEDEGVGDLSSKERAESEEMVPESIVNL